MLLDLFKSFKETYYSIILAQGILPPSLLREAINNKFTEVEKMTEQNMSEKEQGTGGCTGDTLWDTAHQEPAATLTITKIAANHSPK